MLLGHRVGISVVHTQHYLRDLNEFLFKRKSGHSH